MYQGKENIRQQKQIHLMYMSYDELCSYVNNHPLLCPTVVCCQGKSRGLFARRKNSLPPERRVLVSLLSWNACSYMFSCIKAMLKRNEHQDNSQRDYVYCTCVLMCCIWSLAKKKAKKREKGKGKKRSMSLKCFKSHLICTLIFYCSKRLHILWVYTKYESSCSCPHFTMLFKNIR